MSGQTRALAEALTSGDRDLYLPLATVRDGERWIAWSEDEPEDLYLHLADLERRGLVEFEKDGSAALTVLGRGKLRDLERIAWQNRGRLPMPGPTVERASGRPVRESSDRPRLSKGMRGASPGLKPNTYRARPTQTPRR